MGRDDTSEEDGELEFVKYLLAQDMLEGAAEGIAKSVVAKESKEHLTERQLAVYDKYIVKAHKIEHCEQDSERIPWSDMVEAIESGGYCSGCRYRRSVGSEV